MAFAAVVTAGMRATGRLEVPDFPWPLYARAVLPIGMLFATALACSNLAVMRLTVPFVQMRKSIAPVAALAISVTLGVETFTPQLGLVATTMSLSILVNTVGELNFNLVGFVFQIASILSETTRLIVMQKLLQQHLPDKPSPLVPLSLFTPCSFLLLLPVALVFEPGAFPALVANTTTPSLVLLNTCVAFSLNVAVIMLVGSSSGLTLVLAGIVKDVLLVVTSVLLFGSPISYMQVGGYLVGLFGFNSESQLCTTLGCEGPGLLHSTELRVHNILTPPLTPTSQPPLRSEQCLPRVEGQDRDPRASARGADEPVHGRKRRLHDVLGDSRQAPLSRRRSTRSSILCSPGLTCYEDISVQS
jgi:hypothetical protein